jgi:hypothetical protein
MIKWLCDLGIHRWQHSKELHKCEGHPDGRETIRIPIRECKRCGKRQKHTKYQSIGHYIWETIEYNKDTIIKLK